MLEKDRLKLETRAVEGVLERARATLGPLLPRERRELIDLQEWALRGNVGELEIEATLEQSPNPQLQDLIFESKKERRVPVVILLDTSLSMKGEKLALLATGAVVSVLALGIENCALIGYDSEIHEIKHFGQELGLKEVVRKILEIPAGGFTNIQLAIEAAAEEIAEAGRESRALLITDGMYTEGKDPTLVAHLISGLSVLKLGKDISGREILREVAEKGGGQFIEVRNTSELPRRMYELMRAML